MKVSLSDLIKFVEANSYILSSKDLLDSNRSISYISFSLKEIYEYLTMKLSDGVFAFNVRNTNIMNKKYTELLEKLEK